MAVVAVILMVAMLVLPNIVRQQEALPIRLFWGKVGTFLTRVRVRAIQTGTNWQVTYDSNGHRLLAQPVNPSGQSTGSQSISDSQQALTTSQQSVSGQPPQVAQDIPIGVEFQDARIGVNETTPADWTIQFYPDGTADKGAMQFSAGSTIRSYTISKQGSVASVDGSMPDTTNDSWPAGDYVHRQ